MSNLLVDKNLLKHPIMQTKGTLVLGCVLGPKHAPITRKEVKVID